MSGEEHAALEKLATKNGVSMSEIVRGMLTTHLLHKIEHLTRVEFGSSAAYADGDKWAVIQDGQLHGHCHSISGSECKAFERHRGEQWSWKRPDLGQRTA